MKLHFDADTIVLWLVPIAFLTLIALCLWMAYHDHTLYLEALKGAR